MARPYSGVTRRHHQPEDTPARLPDDVAAAMQQRYGAEWMNQLGAYRSLGDRLSLPMIEILRAVAEDKLTDLLRDDMARRDNDPGPPDDGSLS